MPRKPFDPRLLILASQARTEVRAAPSLDAPPLEADSRVDHPHYPWAWCDVTVSAEYGGQEVNVSLPAQSWPGGIRDFMKSEVYHAALAEALTGLLKKLAKAADALAGLGAREDA